MLSLQDPRAHRPRRWRLLRATALLVMALAAVPVLLAGPASAHSELLQASPGAGQQAGGTVDFIDLVFLQPVADAVVEVTYNGAPVPGTMEQANGLIIEFAFDEALSAPGRYDVTYTVTAIDKDRHSSSYFFTYEPASPPAFRLAGQPDQSGEADGGPGGWTSLRIGASVVLVASLCGLAFLYLTRLERRRLQAGADGGDPMETPTYRPGDQHSDR